MKRIQNSIDCVLVLSRRHTVYCTVRGHKTLALHQKRKKSSLWQTHRRFSNHPPSKHFVSHTKIRLGIRAEYQIRTIKGAQGHSLLSNQKDLKLQYPCNKRNKIKSSCFFCFFSPCLKIVKGEKPTLSFPVELCEWQALGVTQTGGSNLITSVNTRINPPFMDASGAAWVWAVTIFKCEMMVMIHCQQ